MTGRSGEAAGRGDHHPIESFKDFPVPPMQDLQGMEARGRLTQWAAPIFNQGGRP
jgi:hypothetical protein